MATDFTKSGNAVQVTEGSANPKNYVGFSVLYFFDAAGTTVSIILGGRYQYDILLADLRVAGSGTAPASVAAAQTALNAVFGLFP